MHKNKWFLFGLSAVLLFSSCNGLLEAPPNDSVDYRQEMRRFVRELSQYADQSDPDFIVIPQNGQELLLLDPEGERRPAPEYLAAIDGVGREDLFFGYDDDNQPTPPVERDYMISFLDTALQHGKVVLVTDYCWTPAYMDQSYAQNRARGYISFAADHREMDHIPAYPQAPYQVNNLVIKSLPDVQNFLYLLNPDNFETKSEYLAALQATDYDLLIIDLFYQDTLALSAADVAGLKNKANGGSRLVVAYLSIGEAEDYRYYWQSKWKQDRPDWLAAENKHWPGNYKVRYWQKGWQDLIFGKTDAYLDRILEAGFDGVYLDIIDAFEYFENQ